MVQPVQVNHISLSNHELIAELLVKVGLDFIFGRGKAWRDEGAVKDAALLFFDETADIIDGVALQSVIFVEFKVVELSE